ncbi:metallophosphoesterase [Mycolicibacterium bacteremicum]|uniref:Metallophosphoesterase n=1 Tax=Mycolicibacterium bacteremicum TaxID=564198 RepID=A0A1W9YZ97_MYCBA|nr:metallophosphoesterase [Mycolicibacterium bacteremicum]MCV7435040.1 metallophosphoesterase [Mycolicibacterium bacteremicum]ORA05289.1 metallophosphoesterase [Mycolicibacterium bacteremicum]
MTDNPAEVVEETTHPPRRSGARVRRQAVVSAVLALLFGVPWWTLVAAGGWPVPVAVIGTLVFASALIGLPILMFTGHGKHRDGPSVLGDALLGAIWVLFVWSVLGNVLRVVLLAAGVDDPLRSRIVAVTVILVAAALLAWGHFEAMRIPRIRRVEVRIPRLGPGLDGLRVAMITDTHYGPINRARWSAGVVDRVNELDADVVCHVGDIADGTVQMRRAQAAPLADVRAATRTYVTGNHEYFSEAQGWLDHMAAIGWDSLHNRHVIVERGGDRLVVAGVDDDTAAGSGTRGHGQDLATALAGADPSLPILLLAHQPKQIRHAVAAGVDLQISGHTHGGQIWPFNFLVRLDQPVVHGLSAHGERTQLYTSRGTGFWGPPFRVFAPSEITLLTLRAG